MRKILITAGEVSASATLRDNPTADAIWDALPIEAPGNTWGDEIYFGIPVHIEEADDAGDVVEIGDLGYWPPGHAFCIFFGRTPASKGDEPRAASPVNPVGRVEGDATVFKGVSSGSTVRLERAEE
ncbi:MAG: cyclophilin-like fold protein [Pseudomonadota bacterium]